MTTRILITGGVGFVGGRLAVQMTHAGHQTVIGSRRSIAPPNWLPQGEQAQIIWDDVTALEYCCKGADVVIHAAGMNAQDCAADPVGALAFNGVATARLVAAASNAGVKRFIYLSTAHVYASPLVGAINEATCPQNLHPYATSHLAGENAVLGASQRGEIEGVVLRLSNAYGAPLDRDANCWGLLINDLCRQAVTTRALVLYSNGLQRRDFVTLTNVCQSVLHLIHLPLPYSGTHVFNVGGGWSPTVFEVACLVADACQQRMGYRPVITRKQPLAGELPADLDYRVDALVETGFQIKADHSAELDGLMSFCVNAFAC